MNVDSILISEFAGVDNAGSLTVYKTFNHMVAPQLPARLNMMAISLIIHAHRSEAGSEHDMEIRLVNSERKVVRVIAQQRIEIGVGEQPKPGLPVRHQVVHVMLNVTFEEEGPYAFEVYFDGTYHASAAFHVGVEG